MTKRKKRLIIILFIVSIVLTIIAGISFFSDSYTRQLILDTYNESDRLLEKYNKSTLYSMICFFTSFLFMLTMGWLMVKTFLGKKD